MTTQVISTFFTYFHTCHMKMAWYLNDENLYDAEELTVWDMSFRNMNI